MEHHGWMGRTLARFIVAALLGFALAACGPSSAEIDDIVDQRIALALTAVPTPTPLPTATPLPSPTPTPLPTPTRTPTPPEPTARPTATPGPTATPRPTATPVIIRVPPDIAGVVQAIGRAVVKVLAREASGTSQGSGVIFTNEGHVLTNNHVVADAIEVEVTLANRRTVPATIVGTDPTSDLAVLKLDPADIAGLAVARLGDTDAMKIGDWVIAIGSPLGFEGSVTVGVVSAKRRSIDLPGDVRLYDLIQTDAVINPGNSGGPLLNLDGEVIGINTAIIRGSIGGGGEAEGIGFAISMGTAIPVSKQLIENGTVVRARFGISILDVTPEETSRLDLSVDEGILVVSAAPGGASARAGIRANDVIVRLNGSRVTSTTDLVRAVLTDFKVGDTVLVTVVRGATTLVFQVTLTAP